MKFTERKHKLPDRQASPTPTSSLWVKQILLGEANILPPKKFSQFSSFDSFLKYIINNPNTVTVCTFKRELDHVFELAGPTFCRALVAPLTRWVNYGSYSIRVGPGGRSLARGVRRITVRLGNKYGYVRDLSELCSSIEEIVPTLELLLDFKLLPSSTPTISALSRNLINSAPSKTAPRKALEELPPSLLEHASSTFRLGRFEAFCLGSVEASVYDKTLAYPTIFAGLNCVYEPFTEWFSASIVKDWRKLLADSSVAYGFFYISVTIPQMEICPLAFRAQLFFSRMEIFCFGEVGGAFVGLETLRLLFDLGIVPNILSGWVGIVRKAYRPYAKLLRDISAGRKRNDRLFKLIGSRFVGSMAGSYLDIEDNKVTRVGLDVWCPVYSAAVVDSMFAEVTRLALRLPRESVYRIGIDSLTTSTDALKKILPKGWREKEEESGKLIIWNEKFVDPAESFRWADTFDGTFLHMKQISYPSLKGTFGPLVNLERRWEKFLSCDLGEDVLIVPGTRKRNSHSFTNFTVDSILTEAYSLPEFYDRWKEMFLEHDEDIFEGERILLE